MPVVVVHEDLTECTVGVFGILVVLMVPQTERVASGQLVLQVAAVVDVDAVVPAGPSAHN